MEGAELRDLIGILRDGRRMDALDECLDLLKAIAWVSPEEKADFWRSLPPQLRVWLSASDRRAA